VARDGSTSTEALRPSAVLCVAVDQARWRIARQRQSALQAARDEHLRELRWKKWRADMQEKRREESLARKEAARIRHAERMRRYREKQKKQRANSNA
jgi:hypothetical protein